MGKWIGRCERAREVILFIPVIFNTVRWDHTSIFIILQHWFGRMQDVHDKDSCHLHAPRYARQLLVCKNLSKRLTTDFHEERVFDEHWERWGKLHTWFTPSDRPDCVRWNSRRENVHTDADKEMESREFKAAMNKAEQLYQNDIDTLFRIIKKYHRHWWT